MIFHLGGISSNAFAKFIEVTRALNKNFGKLPALRYFFIDLPKVVAEEILDMCGLLKYVKRIKENLQTNSLSPFLLSG